MMRRCGCEDGDDCTKTTVCSIESAVEDAVWKKDQEIEKLQVALNTIAASKYCQYEHSGTGQYGIGVADGHRWCAQVAKDALK